MKRLRPDRRPANQQPVAAGGATGTTGAIRAAREVGGERWRKWDQVGITHVATVEAGHGTPAGHRRVRTLVRLGRLTPADVKVHLTTQPPTADVAPDAGWRRRLACAQTYANGTFVFEGNVPEQLLREGRRLVVLVEPQGDAGEPVQGLEPIHRTVPRNGGGVEQRV